MASLLPKDGTLLNHADQAPAPSKDYCQILVKKHKVIVRVWKITMRHNAQSKPTQVLDTFEDFEHDDRCHSKIHAVFGKGMLEYVKNLVSGHIDYLPRMPRELLIEIIRHLELEDIASLGRTSKQFQELCNSDELWEHIYHDHSETPVTDELRSLAEALGWKRLFFTNKLQLQRQLRRQAQKHGKKHSAAFMTQH